MCALPVAGTQHAPTARGAPALHRGRGLVNALTDVRLGADLALLPPPCFAVALRVAACAPAPHHPPLSMHPLIVPPPHPFSEQGATPAVAASIVKQEEGDAQGDAVMSEASAATAATARPEVKVEDSGAQKEPSEVGDGLVGCSPSIICVNRHPAPFWAACACPVLLAALAVLPAFSPSRICSVRACAPCICVSANAVGQLHSGRVRAPRRLLLMARAVEKAARQGSPPLRPHALAPSRLRTRAQADIAAAGAHQLLPVLGNVWDLRKLLDVWNLLHGALLDHAYAAAPERCARVRPLVSGTRWTWSQTRSHGCAQRQCARTHAHARMQARTHKHVH